jgi:hypothetical protein
MFFGEGANVEFLFVIANYNNTSFTKKTLKYLQERRMKSFYIFYQKIQK